MKPTDELLTTDLWKRVSSLARRAKTRKAAIAYVTSEQVCFGDGDLLIVDASERAITSGKTAARVLLAAKKRGAAVCSCPDLHAKLIVVDDTVLIGSANLSNHSANHLEECAVLTKQPALVGQARAFLQQLRERCKPLSQKKLEALAALPVVRPDSGRRFQKGRTASLGKRRWIVGLTPINDENMTVDDERTATRGKRKLEERFGEARKDLGWVRLRGRSNMRKHSRAGDRMIMVNGARSSSNHLQIDAPLTILSREVGKDSTFLYYDAAERSRPSVKKSDFIKMIDEAGISLVPSPRMARELPVEVFDLLDEKWRKQ